MPRQWRTGTENPSSRHGRLPMACISFAPEAVLTAILSNATSVLEPIILLVAESAGCISTPTDLGETSALSTTRLLIRPPSN